METTIVLRAAKQEDCDNIFKWRNAAEIRQASLQSHEIAYDDHKKWFANILEASHCDLLIAEILGQPIGVLRFDITEPIAEISIYLTPDHIGKGLGLTLLKTGESWLKANRKEIKTIKARILYNNTRSYKVFANAGFDPFLTELRKEIIHE